MFLDLFLYADNSCLVFQHKDVKEIERNLNKNLSNICGWFADNKLSVHSGDNKTKCILFGTKHRLNKVGTIDISMIKHTLSIIKQRHIFVAHWM